MDTNPHPEARCLACRGTLRFFGPREKYKYFLCENCRSIQLFPLPTQEQLERLYQKEYMEENEMEKWIAPESWEQASMNYQRAILTMIRKHGIKGPLVDFGAGYGHLVEFLKNNGVDCSGLDLSKAKLAYCGDRSIDVRYGGLAELSLMKGRISGVVMIAVFEHLSDHRDFLKRVYECLPDQGVLISLHPTSSIFRLLGEMIRLGRRHRELPGLLGAFAPPWHTAFVSLQGMIQLSEENGFVVQDIQPAPQGRLPGAWGLVQAALEMINRLGWFLCGQRWPLATSHTFLLRKQNKA